jgi:hypothetical protein
MDRSNFTDRAIAANLVTEVLIPGEDVDPPGAAKCGKNHIWPAIFSLLASMMPAPSRCRQEFPLARAALLWPRRSVCCLPPVRRRPISPRRNRTGRARPTSIVSAPAKSPARGPSPPACGGRRPVSATPAGRCSSSDDSLRCPRFGRCHTVIVRSMSRLEIRLWILRARAKTRSPRGRTGHEARTPRQTGPRVLPERKTPAARPGFFVSTRRMAALGFAADDPSIVRPEPGSASTRSARG